MISEFGMFFTLIRLIFMALVVPGGFEIRRLGKPGAVLFDIKGIFEKSGSDLRL